MIITIIFFLLIIFILTYYYYHYLQNHFWYNFVKNIGETRFYSGKLHPNIYSKKDLTEIDKNELVKLYANYMEGVVINKEKIENFLSIMPYSEIYYMKVNSIYYGAIMNSIIEIKYKNKTYLSNFVDNAIINKNHREKGIFKELMNYISNYSNEMNTKFIIFKIDRKPIPSFYDYNIVSNYYYICSSKKGTIPFYLKKKATNCSQIVSPYYKNEDQFFKYKNSKNIIILSCLSDKNVESDNWENDTKNLGVIPFFKKDKATTIIFKRNSPESIELLYIHNPKKECIHNIMQYLYNNYTFDIFFVDDIGNNSHLIKAYPNLFKIAYPVYHYILGLKDKISKENFFYYF
jgi:hypothetical protein